MLGETARIVVWTVAGFLVGQIAALVPAAANPRSWQAAAHAAGEFALGALAVAALAGPGSIAESLACTAVVAGRLWPPLRRSRETVGLLVAAGAVTMITPLALPLWALLWAVGFVATGYRGAGTVVATGLLPLAVGLVAGWPFALIIAPAWFLVLVRLRPQARRVLLGVDRKYHWRSGA